MTEIVKIPAERIKAVRGENDSIKKLIERKCSVTLTIDEEGDVEIGGDPTEVFFAKDIVKAIGRGFEPRDAMRLGGHDYNLYIIQLKEVVGSDKAISRVKSRVIGTKGKIKKEI